MRLEAAIHKHMRVLHVLAVVTLTLKDDFLYFLTVFDPS